MGFTVVEDLNKWAAALKDGILLREEFKKKMLTGYLCSYGYGWFIGRSPIEARHSGGINVL